MQATRFLMNLLQETTNYVKNSEEKKKILEDQVANFIFERSVSIYNKEGNTDLQSEILCYMYYFVCKKTYINSCWGDENLSEDVKRNNLINLSKSIAKDMVEYYLYTLVPAGAFLPPQNSEEKRVFNFLTNVRNLILS